MTDMFRSEMKLVLSQHRLVDASGWMDDNGRVEYECRCGRLMHETPRTSIFKGGATMLAEHQAEVLDKLGFRRTPDLLDASALDQLFSTVIQRFTEITHIRDTRAWAMSSDDRNRLHGAHEELKALQSTLEALTNARFLGRNGETERDTPTAAVA